MGDAAFSDKHDTVVTHHLKIKMQISNFRVKYQGLIHRVGLAIALGLQIIVGFNITLPQTTVNAITFAILSYILLDISNNTRNLPQKKAYEAQIDMYTDIIKYLDEKVVKQAILIQYSGIMSMLLLQKLMSKGANVKLYVHEPETTRNEGTEKQFDDNISQFLKTTLKQYEPISTLEIHYYNVPASIRGVLIDDEVLGIGWYTYTHKINDDNKSLKNKFEVTGYNIAGILFYKGSNDYEIFKRMFKEQVKDYDEYNKSKK
ncbi:MAG: hypothetical protein AAFQ91_26400 [Cyanobacteria bacterium J06621_15]